MSDTNAVNKSLFEYLLWLGDNNLILGHRVSEWCGHGPILEEDIALTNIALDLVGQSRLLYTYAGEVEGKGRDEDDLAYLRDVMDYRNAMLLEQTNGDFAYTIMRQFLFSAFDYQLLTALCSSTNENLKAIAEKAIKEVTYHLRHTSDWVIRLGDGTEESHQRLQDAINAMWMFTDELFDNMASDKVLIEQKIVPDLTTLRPKWDAMVKQVLDEATIKMPERKFMMKGSRNGIHTEHLGYILAELQFMQRAYPGAKW